MKRSREMFTPEGYGPAAFFQVTPMHEICQATGKICFATRRAALRAWLGVRGRAKDGTRRSAYECHHCGLFHFGQSKTKDRQSAAAKRFRRSVREVFQELEDQRFLRR